MVLWCISLPSDTWVRLREFIINLYKLMVEERTEPRPWLQCQGQPRTPHCLRKSWSLSWYQRPVDVDWVSSEEGKKHASRKVICWDVWFDLCIIWIFSWLQPSCYQFLLPVSKIWCDFYRGIATSASLPCFCFGSELHWTEAMRGQLF